MRCCRLNDLARRWPLLYLPLRGLLCSNGGQGELLVFGPSGLARIFVEFAALL